MIMPAAPLALLLGSGLLIGLVSSFVSCEDSSRVPSAGAPARPPHAETERGCASAVYGGEVSRRALGDAVVAGPLTLAIEAGWAERRARAYVPQRILKVLAIVRGGEEVTLVVPAAERSRLSLLYAATGRGPRRPLRLSDGTRSVRFKACEGSAGPGPQPYPDPRETQFNGGFFVRGAQCAPLEVRVAGREKPLRRWLPLGTDGRPCPGGST